MPQEIPKEGDYGLPSCNQLVFAEVGRPIDGAERAHAHYKCVKAGQSVAIHCIGL